MTDRQDIRHGDARALLAELPDQSVACVVTSPPYYGLRDYGVEGQIGLERTLPEYVEALVAVFREVRRVLSRDGSLWLNLGDCYATGAGRVGEHPGGGEQGARWKGATNTKDPKSRSALGPLTQPNRMPQPGLKPKDLCGVPWRVAFALQADGWWLRQEIIWAKPNPMPESIRDRCTRSHEQVFHLTRARRYFYDADAIAEPLAPASIERLSQPTFDKQCGGPKDYANGTNGNRSARRALENLRSGYRSGNKQRDIPDADDGRGIPNDHLGRGVPWQDKNGRRNKRSVWTVATQPFPEAHFATFPEALVEPCVLATSRPGDLVLDPFAGAGTVGVVSKRLDRAFLGLELSADYCELARRRIARAPAHQHALPLPEAT